MEEVAQDAWLGLLRGLDRFEGRSSLRTCSAGQVEAGPAADLEHVSAGPDEQALAHGYGSA